VYAEEYLVHASLLRPHGEFPCAGDVEAMRFCREVTANMVRRFGISRREAVGRVNRQWSEPNAGGVAPRVWIVGLDLAYHDTAEQWASKIYFGDQPRWWDPDADLEPVPPPP
jgi:hypothetical protein